jgi:ketosteroid isomerase-like protein
MKHICVLLVGVLAGGALLVRAQSKSEKLTASPALEKELYAVELKWMKAEQDKAKEGPDSMGELWTDQFFDVLSSGQVVNKQEMMEMMSKGEHKPGTGAFPVDFKIRAIYGDVVLATDHTTIKGVDKDGNIVPTREMSVLRMFVRENGKWRVAGAGLVTIPPPAK